MTDVRITELRDSRGRLEDLTPHRHCDNRIAALKEECGGLRIRVRELEQALAIAKEAAATADGIAVAVFNAIRNASKQGMAQKAPMVT